MKESREQLENLLRCFYDEEQVVQAASDIEAAESLLAADSPLPRPEVLFHIKQSLRQKAAALSRKRQLYRHILTAAAACLAAAIGLWNIHLRIESPVGLQKIMVRDFFADDAVQAISSSLDDISEQIYTGSSSGKEDSWANEVGNEIEEMVLIAQADFWKG